MKKKAAGRPAKKKAYKKRNKEYWDSLKNKGRTNALPNDFKIVAYEIESKPPSYRSNPDLEITLKRVEATVHIIKPGEAFVVPSKSRHTIKKFIEEKWPNLLFRYSKIKDNPGMMRIYFLRSA
jgi:hypothetical protein